MSRRKPSKRRALLSVSDKKGLVPFAEELVGLSFELVSTGGTAALLREAQVPVTDVATLTGFPEIMDGRVKTLHPAVHGGLLARLDIDDAARTAHGIELIDLLVVNLYPFEQVAGNPSSTDADVIENIDVGGPAMLRAAAKNHARVSVVVDVTDYERILDYYRAGEPPAEFRRHLAAKAFAHTAAYDAAISAYLRSRLETQTSFPERLALGWQRKTQLRYGENPHQSAALYVNAAPQSGSVAAATQLQGKALSFNNLVDADAALQCARSFAEPACVIVKHANPCGVATAKNLNRAYQKAYDCDPTSAFGGVIAFNGTVDAKTAESILDNQFAEVVVAPRVEDPARDVFAKKPNMRLLECGARTPGVVEWELKSLEGGILVQDRDTAELDEAEVKVVSKRAPTKAEMRDLRFAWRVARFVKSNAIVFARDSATLGIGAGQMSRVMSVRIAALQAEEREFSLQSAVMASDAFFPFRDGIDAAAASGISAVVQPGGSVRDDEVVAAANAHGMAMIFTGMRHFRH